jgi:hypothetical protein
MQERSDALAFRYGALIGAAGGVLGLLLVIMITVAKGDPGVALAGCVGFLAGFALLFEAGHITAKQTGTVGSGTLAGATAGLLMGIGLGMLSLIEEIRSGKLHSLGQMGIILGILLTLLFFGALFAGIGAGVGALGSLVGQAGFRRARRNEMAVTDSN